MAGKAQRRWPVVLGIVLVVGIVVAVVVMLTCPPVRQSPAQATAEPTAQQEQTTQPEQATEPKEPDVEQTTYQTELAAQFAAGEVRSVRLVGDSITAGYGTDGYENPDITGEGLVIYDDGAGLQHHQVTESADSWANAFRAWATERGVEDFVNAGINGAFMMELAADPDAWLADGADVIFVALGTNDAGYYGPGEYADAARTALEAAAQKCQTLVVVSPVADLRPESMLVEPAVSLADELRPICEECGYLFVDASEAVSPEQFCDDGLHPNTDGSLAIWACIRDTLGL